jgi:HlyD family secretion protein
VVLLGVFLLAAAGITGVLVLRGDGNASVREAAATSDVARAEMGSFDIVTLAMGELEAKNRIELRNRMDGVGTIVEIVPEGTTVKAGDVLVRLNSDAIEDEIVSDELALDEANAELMAAETALEIQRSENDSKLRTATLKVDLASLALDQWREGELVKTRKEQAVAIDQAQRQLERLQDKCDKNEELLAKQFLSLDEYKSDKMALLKAQADLELARLTAQVYETYQKPRDEKQKMSDLEEAKAELDRVKQENDINMTSRQATVSNRRRQVERREQSLEEEREQLAFSVVEAPSSGLVVYGSTAQQDNWRNSSEGPLQVGRQVGPNDLLIVLPDTGQMVAKVRVHESLAGRIHPGQEADIKIEAVGRTIFRGTVESVGVMAESAGWRDPNLREYSVRIEIDPSQDTAGLKPSMRAEAHILIGRVDGVVNVPIQAVFIDGPVTFVYQPEAGKYARHPVQLGRRSDTRAEIVSGLDAGERVLLRAPTPGEVISRPWDQAELKSAGYALDAEGKPISDPVPGTRPGRHAPGQEAAHADAQTGGVEKAGKPATTEGFEGAPAGPAVVEPAAAEAAG